MFVCFAGSGDTPSCEEKQIDKSDFIDFARSSITNGAKEIRTL
jgi:hypothetical protein